MAGKRKSVSQLKEVAALRLAGYSISAIAHKTNISPATITRLISKHHIEKGVVTASVIESAKEEFSASGGASEITQAVKSVLLDDIALYSSLRQAIAVNLEQVMSDDELEAGKKARAIAALSTSAIASQVLIRKTLDIDSVIPDADDLPTLTISELTADDILELQRDDVLTEDVEGLGLPLGSE